MVGEGKGEADPRLDKADPHRQKEKGNKPKKKFKIIIKNVYVSVDTTASVHISYFWLKLTRLIEFVLIWKG